MTNTVQITDNNVTAGDILLRLDTLAQGYEEILEQAKQQLERFEPSAEQWARLASKIQDGFRYRSLVNELVDRMLTTINRVEAAAASGTNENLDDDDRQLNELFTFIAKRAAERLISTDLEIAIKTEVQDKVRSLQADIQARVEVTVLNHIKRLESEEVRQASNTNYHFRSMVDEIFGAEFKRLAKQAAAEAIRQGDA
jgi:23S rRNA G2445 N2-methylase RlmL